MISERLTPQIKTSWSFLEKLGESSLEKVHHAAFSSGIEMISMDFTSDSIWEHAFSVDRSPLIFSFHLSGYMKGKVIHSKTKCRCVPCEQGETAVYFNPESSFKTKIFDRQHCRFINIYIAPHRLREKLEEEMDQVPARLHRILKDSTQRPYIQKINMSPHVRMVVDQIFNCPYKGALKKLYLESKCMELIISRLSETRNGTAKNRPLRLHPADRERIHYAEEVLLSDMGNPPSLNELAKITGLNENKLNRGFRQEFGMTVYKYYQMERIKRSKEILDEGRLNIDETAHLLGFFDTAHFIKHFKNYFGTTPGIYLKTSPFI